MLTSKTNIENKLKRSLSTREEDLLTLLLPAIDRIVENYTSRKFTAGSGRLYDADGSNVLYIDPVKTITKLEYVASDGTLTEIDGVKLCIEVQVGRLAGGG